MKILLLGSNGQVGQAFQELSKTDAFPIGWSLTAWGRADGDFSDPENLLSRIQTFAPEVILNAAAYTQVDLAEKERENCERINATVPALLAEFSAKNAITLVHFSSDYVYAGMGTEPHLETEIPHAQNYYGLTKAQGDGGIARSGCDHFIFRTSWVYSHSGKNFVKTMLKLGETKTELSVVNDQVGSPTYAPDLAMIALDCLMQGLEKKADGKAFPSGVYHLTNSGFTTWAEFAKTILPQVQILGIPTSDYPTPAKRPLNSRLSLEKLRQAFDVRPRTWQAALSECLSKIEASK